MMDIASGQEAVNTMTQDVFNLLARSVNKDFVHLGFPTILTKKSGRDFVSLCALMNNCSALLASVKARSDQVTAAAVAALDSSAKCAATGKSSQPRKCRGGGIFSSRSSLKLASLQATEASVFGAIAEKVRRDTEDVIESTRCLPEPGELDSAAASGDQQQQQCPDRQLTMFFATRWVQFKETVTRKLLEAGQLAVEVQSLRTALGRGLPRSKSASGDASALSSSALDPDSRPRQRSLSRPAAEGHVSVTKIPSLEAEIRRLKLEMNRREQRHKDELDRQAKERERLARDFRLAQRRIPGPRWPANTTAASQPNLQLPLHHPGGISQPPPLQLPQLPQLMQLQQSNSDSYDHIVSDVCQTLEKLAECLGSQHQPQLRPEAADKRQGQHQQQHLRSYVDSVCSAALTRIQCLQADCCVSHRRQADLEVLVSILKARLDLTNDQVTDVAKFEAAVNDIARKLTTSVEGSAQPPQPPQDLLVTVTGDEHRGDSLVSRLTSRLRERQRPQ